MTRLARALEDARTLRLPLGGVATLGATLGTGVVQRHELAAGDYVLLVSAPAEGGPLRIRPALVGLQQPGSGPPEEVIRTYLELAKQGEGGR